MRQPRALLACFVLLGVLSACGSTATLQSTGTGPTGAPLGGDGLGLPPTGPGSQTTGGLGDGSTTGGIVIGPGGSTSGGTSGLAGSTGGSATTGSSSTGGQSFAFPSNAAVGVTDKEIRIGVPHCEDCAAANAGLGAGGEDPGDTKRYYSAAIEDVNNRGGIHGRKLVPVWHQISVSTPIEQSQQNACETFTKDNKVAAIFFRGEIVYSCALKAGIIATGDGGTAKVYQQFPNLFSPASIRQERLGAVTVKAMIRAGWHKPEPRWPRGRIGLITWEDTTYKYAMENGWLPALHDAGLKEHIPVRYIAVPQSDSSIADAGAAISSAVLAFNNAGIDHVFIADGPAGIFTGTGLTLLFLRNAEAQGYKPRYGFNTYNSPGWENLPASQQVGMLAVDSADTERANDEGIPLNPQRERCWSIMAKKGLPVGQSQTQSLAVGACDIAWFAEAILKRATSPRLADVIAAGHSLGTSYRSPFMYGTKLTATQRDGTQLFRNARYDEGCSCMRYTSKPYEP